VQLMFQYSSTSRNCRNLYARAPSVARTLFQYSSTSRNCRNVAQHLAALRAERVSVLFNESKLPKCNCAASDQFCCDAVSVLFNESKLPKSAVLAALAESTYVFQYSSTSRNCRNRSAARQCRSSSGRFQYSSTSRNCRNLYATTPHAGCQAFQYSSTSRNCRNSSMTISRVGRGAGFSTLQRVEIAEIVALSGLSDAYLYVSVLFNESKLPKL